MAGDAGYHYGRAAERWRLILVMTVCLIFGIASAFHSQALATAFAAAAAALYLYWARMFYVDRVSQNGG